MAGTTLGLRGTIAGIRDRAVARQILPGSGSSSPNGTFIERAPCRPLMPLYVAEHTHPAERCPAGNPQMAAGLLALIKNAGGAGITIHGDAVTDHQHHLYIIAEAANEQTIRQYLAPFGQMGTLSVTPASHCEQVVARGAC